MSNNFDILNELTHAGVVQKQSDITSLFPDFADKVKGIADMGGLRMEGMDQDAWHFKIHSGTKPDVWYDASIKWLNVSEELNKYAANQNIWTKDQQHVNLLKLSKEVSTNADIQLSCTCKAFKYYGPDYILSLSQYNAKYGDPEHRPPNIRNPKQHGAVCKHLHNLLNVLPWWNTTMASWLRDNWTEEIRQIENRIKQDRPDQGMSEPEFEPAPRQPAPRQPAPQQRPQRPRPHSTKQVAPQSPRTQSKDTVTGAGDQWFMPKWSKQRERKLYEDTTMGDIAYLPSALGVVRSALGGLAKKKRQWNIEVLEVEKGSKVHFEDALCIYVPKECWEDFAMMFKDPLHKGVVTLDEYLQEAIDAELADRRKEIEPQITRVFEEDTFRTLDKSVQMWRARFGINNNKTSDVVVAVENKRRDVRKLVGELFRNYGNDLGNLDLLIKAFRNHQPLNAFAVFKNYDYLYGTRMYSSYEGVQMVFEGTVDMSYSLGESIAIIDGDEILDELEDYGGVRVVRNLLYPVRKTFDPDFFGYLAEVIEEQTSLGDDEGDDDEGFDYEEDKKKNRRSQGRKSI
jgi:hypothetical protein